MKKKQEKKRGVRYRSGGELKRQAGTCVGELSIFMGGRGEKDKLAIKTANETNKKKEGEKLLSRGKESVSCPDQTRKRQISWKGKKAS